MGDSITIPGGSIIFSKGAPIICAYQYLHLTGRSVQIAAIVTYSGVRALPPPFTARQTGHRGQQGVRRLRGRGPSHLAPMPVVHTVNDPVD